MKTIKTHYIIASINPKSGEQEYLCPDEWGDYWSIWIDSARKYESVDAKPIDGMARKGTLAKGRVLEIWKIVTSLAEVVSVDQAEQFAKEERVKRLQEQLKQIQSEIDKACYDNN